MDKRERNDIFRVLDEETLKNSKKDVRSRSFLFPKRILWTAGQVENSRRLLEKEEMQISLKDLKVLFMVENCVMHIQNLTIL